ncbi:MAG TPA: potassium/proton antiporter [Anaerolineaceae bacterium]
MPATIEPYLVFAAILLILSVAVSKISDRFGIPALLLFLALGMLAGSDGPGGIYFDDPALAQSLGITALAIILFSGGLDTSWKSIRPVFKEGIVLATLGVLLTAILAGVFAHLVLKTTLLEGILLGAIMSSTDAAAVFAVLRSKGIHLAGRLKPLLELESGSNDPMAVFLTIGLTQLVVQPQQSIFQLVLLFFQQMALGVVFGIVAAKITLYLINRLQLGYSGLYPVLTLGTVFLTFSATNLLGGSGFLAVYLAGLLMGRQEFLHKRSLLRFYDGLAWLMQIGMFLTLGLLVFPSRLGQVALPGLAIALFLLVVARPLAVMVSLAWFRIRLPEKALVAWVGLRGAVPIILATYPRIMGLEQSDLIFNVVFFVVLTSVLLQGTTIPLVAERLGVKSEAPPETSYPIEYVSETEWKGILQETVIPPGSWAIGKPIYELGLPGNYLIVLISREGDFIIPSGSIVLQVGDKMLGLSEPHIHAQVEQMFRRSSD